MSILNHLKRLQNDQIEEASRVAARAFQNDPLTAYYYPDPIERKIKTVIWCEYMILLGILSGEVYTTSNDIEGVIVWNAFRIKDQTIGKQSKEIIRKLRKVKREFFSDSLFLERYGIVSQIHESFHKKYANFPHIGLTMFVVDPLYQGKGYANILIKPKLIELDKQNLPCYLDTQNKKNVSFYKHFGFELVGEIMVPNSNVNFYGMLRKKKD